MRSKAFASLLGLLALLVSCRSDEGQRQGSEWARTIDTLTTTPVWTYNSDLDDSDLLAPRAMLIWDSLVVVADGYSHHLVLFRLDDGSVVTRLGGPGDGPGEFRDIRDLAVGPSGELMVLDRRRHVIVAYDPDLSLREEISIPGSIFGGEAFCPLASGAFLIQGSAPAGIQPSVHLVRPGPGPGEEDVLPQDLPWEVVDDDDTVMRIGAHFAPVPGGRGCVMALSRGVGFAYFDRTSFAYAKEYVEPIELPEIDVQSVEGRVREQVARRSAAAWSVTVLGDTILVLFEGTSSLRHRLVDMYRVANGAYRGTLLLPDDFLYFDMRANSIAGLDADSLSLPRLRVYSLER